MISCPEMAIGIVQQVSFDQNRSKLGMFDSHLAISVQLIAPVPNHYRSSFLESLVVLRPVLTIVMILSNNSSQNIQMMNECLLNLSVRRSIFDLNFKLWKSFWSANPYLEISKVNFRMMNPDSYQPWSSIKKI